MIHIDTPLLNLSFMIAVCQKTPRGRRKEEIQNCFKKLLPIYLLIAMGRIKFHDDDAAVATAVDTNYD